MHQTFLMRGAETKLGKCYPDEKKNNKIQCEWMQWPRLITLNGEQVFVQEKGCDGGFVGKCSHLSLVDSDVDMKK